MDEKETTPPGLLDTLRQLGATVLATIHNRLELLIVELQEHRARLVETLVLVAAMVALAFFTLALATVAVIIVVWARFGITGLLVLSGVGLIGTLLLGWQLRKRLRSWPLLEATLAELRKDRECLENK